MAVQTRNEKGEDGTRYIGQVLALGEHYIGDGDYEAYALAWDAEKGHIVRAFYGFCGNNLKAEIDATPEAQTAARAWLRQLWVKYWDTTSYLHATEVIKGREVRVIRGRKVPIGTEGKVFWKGNNQRGRYSWQNEERVGLLDKAGNTHWTAAHNTEVINPGQYEMPAAEIQLNANTSLGTGNWDSPPMVGLHY